MSFSISIAYPWNDNPKTFHLLLVNTQILNSKNLQPCLFTADLCLIFFIPTNPHHLCLSSPAIIKSAQTAVRTRAGGN